MLSIPMIQSKGTQEKKYGKGEKGRGSGESTGEAVLRGKTREKTLEKNKDEGNKFQVSIFIVYDKKKTFKKGGKGGDDFLGKFRGEKRGGDSLINGRRWYKNQTGRMWRKKPRGKDKPKNSWTQSWLVHHAGNARRSEKGGSKGRL